MKKIFPGPITSLHILRISIAIVFLAHAIVRIVNGTIPQFAGFMGSKGFPYPEVVVWMLTIVEIVAGSALLSGYFIRIAALIFIIILVTGIILIHAGLGWFVGEHGTGGVEYSFILIAGLLAVAANRT